MTNEIIQPQNNLPATITDRFATLRRKATHTPEIWNPEPGGLLIGVLIRSQKAVGPYGENYQMLIQDESGAVTAAWLTQWLKENLRAQGTESFCPRWRNRHIREPTRPGNGNKRLDSINIPG